MAILSNGHQWKYSEFLDNKDYSFDKDQILRYLQHNYKVYPTYKTKKNESENIYICKIYKEDELIRFLVSNFVKTNDLWVGNITSPEGRQTYIAWKAKIQGLPYVFENEIDTLFDQSSEFNLLFDCRDGQHPPVLRRLFGEEVSIESFIIMDSILHFTSTFNEEIEETVIWPDLYSMCLKYAPFLNVNKQKYVDILKKQVELHYA